VRWPNPEWRFHLHRNCFWYIIAWWRFRRLQLLPDIISP